MRVRCGESNLKNMKQRLDFKSFALGTLAAGLLALTVGAIEGKSALPVEHKVVIDSPLPISHSMHVQFATEALNQYAADGWEVVSSHLFYDHEAGERLMRETVLRRTKKQP